MANGGRGLRFTICLATAFIILFINVAQSEEYLRTKRRMYAMCPPSFERIGSDCYYVSKQSANWLDGHFNCKDKNAKLAEPEKVADRKLRQFLLKNDNPSQGEIWIGGSFDRINKVWQWGYTGVNITHTSFSKLDPWSRQTMDYQCIVLNPNLKYRWSARSCVQNHRYVCQHKMPKVSEKNRFKVYNRWNQTYPNQFANEVVLEVINNPSTGSRQTSFVRPVGSNETISIRTRRKHYPSAALPISFELIPSTPRPPSTLQQNNNSEIISNEINPIRNRSFGDLIVIEKSPEQIMRERGNRRQQRPRIPTQPKRTKLIENNETPSSAGAAGGAAGSQYPKRTSFDINVAKKRMIERRLKIRQQRKLRREQLKQEKLAAQKRLAENEASTKRLEEAKAVIERQREYQKQEEANRLKHIENEKFIEKQKLKEKMRRQEEHRQNVQEKEKEEAERLFNEKAHQQMKVLYRADEQERIEKLEEERERLKKEEIERVEKEQFIRKQKEQARLEAKLAQEAQLRKLAEEERQQEEEQKRLEEAERKQFEEEEELKNRERLLKEEEIRLQREREEDKRRIKALRQEKQELELKKRSDEKRREQYRKLQNRLSKLSEPDRLKFLERLRQKHKNEDLAANEAH